MIDAAELIRATTNEWPSTFQKNEIPGDFVGRLPERAFETVSGGATQAGVDPWIQWAYADTSFVELASVMVHGVDVEVATHLDEMFDDGVSNQGSIRTSIGASGVAGVQFDVVFVIK